jgi:thioredoxin-dependent peroxiredoxin
MGDILRPGSRAPEFTVKADDGKNVALKDFRGKNVVLYFFPKAMTPG